MILSLRKSLHNNQSYILYFPLDIDQKNLQNTTCIWLRYLREKKAWMFPVCETDHHCSDIIESETLSITVVCRSNGSRTKKTVVSWRWDFKKSRRTRVSQSEPKKREEWSRTGRRLKTQNHARHHTSRALIGCRLIFAKSLVQKLLFFFFSYCHYFCKRL